MVFHVVVSLECFRLEQTVPRETVLLYPPRDRRVTTVHEPRDWRHITLYYMHYDIQFQVGINIECRL